MASTGYLSQYAGKTKTTSRVAGTGFLSQYSNYNSPENIAKRKKLQEEQKRNIEEQQKSAFQKQTMPIQSTATGKDLTYNQTQNAFITAQRPTYKSQQLQGKGQPIVTQNPQVQLNEEQQKADTRIADSVLSNPNTTEEKKSLALKVKKLNDQIDQGKKAGIEVEGGLILSSIKDIAKSATGVLGIDKSSQSTLDILRRYTSKDSELAGLQAEYSALKEKQKLVNPNSGFVDFVNSALNSAEYGIEFVATKAGKAGAPLFIIGSGVNDINKRNTDLVGYDQKTNSYYIKENNVKQYQERVENPKELAKDLTVSIANQALQYIVEEKLGQITEKLIGTLAKPLLKNPVVSAGTSKILSTNLGKFFQKIGSTQFGNTGKSILDISKTVKGLAGIQGFTGEQAEEEVQYILDKIANNIIDETDDKLSLMSNQERLMSILTIGVMQLAPIGATKVVNEAYKKIANSQTQKALIEGGISKEQAKILAPLITDKAMAANEEISQQPQPETQVEVTKTPQNQVLPEQTNVVTQEQKKEEIKPVEEVKSEAKPIIATSGVEIADKGIYAELTPEQLDFLKNETKNIEFTAEDKPHITPTNKLQKSDLKLVTLDELLKESPNLAKALDNFNKEKAKISSTAKETMETKEKVIAPKLSERKTEDFSQTIKKTQPQLSSKMREEVAQYAYDLAQGTGKGVNDGYLIYDENNRVIGRVGWTSNNDVWYQEWFKEYKRPPSLTEITQKALDDLKQGQPEEYYDKEYLSTIAGQNFTKEIKETTVKKGTLPVKGTGEVKASKLETRLKGLSDKVKNLSEEEANDLGVGMYEALKNKDQLSKAGEFVKNNPQEALDVITGKKETPKDLLTNAVFVAYTEYAKEQADNGNYEPLLRSASLQATRMGQELQILSKIDPNNPVAIANQVYEIRVKEIQEKNGQNYRKQVDKETAKAKKEVNKENKSDWAKFIDSIKC